MSIDDSWGGAIVNTVIDHLVDCTPESSRFASTDFNDYVTVSTANRTLHGVTEMMEASWAPSLGIHPKMEVLGEPVLEVC